LPHPPAEEGLEGVVWEVIEDEHSDDEGGGGGGGVGGGGTVSSQGAAVVASNVADGGSSEGVGGELASPGSGGSGSGGDGAGDSPGSGPDSPSDPGGSASTAVPVGDASSTGSDGVKGGAAWGGICTQQPYIDALNVVAETARLTRNDALLRVIEKQLSKSSKKRSAETTWLACELRKAARRDREEVDRRRKELADLDREAKNSELDGKLALEQAKQATVECKRAALAAAREARLAADHRRNEDRIHKDTNKWLQVRFPLALAERVEAWRAQLPPPDLEHLTAAIQHVADTKRCDRYTVLPDLWDDDPSLTRPIGSVQLAGGNRVAAKSPIDFEWALFRGRWASEHAGDPAAMLFRLLEKVLPGCGRRFQRRHTPPWLIAVSGGNVAKAFVAAVVLLSKWLGRGVFPAGVHEWPPPRETPDAVVIAA